MVIQGLRASSAKRITKNLENKYYIVEYDGKEHAPCLKLDGGAYTPIFTCKDSKYVIKFGVEVIHNNTIVFPYLREILIYKLLQSSLNCGYSLTHKMYKCESLILMHRYNKHDFWTALAEDQITFDNIFNIIKKLINGLYEMHTNRIAHRDLKIDNIIIHKNEDDWDVRIIDFNMARFFPLNVHEVFDQPYDICTVNYRAPEYFKLPGENKTLKTNQYFKADIWSLGCIMYYLIFKKHYVTVFEKTEFYEVMKAIHYAEYKLTYESYIEELTCNYGLVETNNIDTYFMTMKACLTYEAKDRPSIYGVIETLLLPEETISSHEIELHQYIPNTDETLFSKILGYTEYYYHNNDLTKLFIIEQTMQYINEHPDNDTHTVVLLNLGIFTHFDKTISYEFDKKTIIQFIDNIKLYDCLTLQEIEKCDEKISQEQHDIMYTSIKQQIGKTNN